VGPSAVLDAVVKRKIHRESNPRTPIVLVCSVKKTDFVVSYPREFVSRSFNQLSDFQLGVNVWTLEDCNTEILLDAGQDLGKVKVTVEFSLW
jgi:hypothetical protein